MSTEKPYVKWYGRDWLGDPQLRMVGPAERGVWIDLLSIMMMAEPYGHLAVNGRPMTDEETARMIGIDTDTYKGYLYRLIEAGIPSKTPEGIVYSRRLVRDHQRYMMGKLSGKKGGGNPLLRCQAQSPSIPPYDTNQNPEARSHISIKGTYKGTYIGEETPPAAAPILLDEKEGPPSVTKVVDAIISARPIFKKVLHRMMIENELKTYKPTGPVLKAINAFIMAAANSTTDPTNGFLMLRGYLRHAEKYN